jgi:hypothetical protein
MDAGKLSYGGGERNGSHQQFAEHVYSRGVHALSSKHEVGTLGLLPNLRMGHPTLSVDDDAADAMNPGPYLVAWPTGSEWRNPRDTQNAGTNPV